MTGRLAGSWCSKLILGHNALDKVEGLAVKDQSVCLSLTS